MRSQSIIVQNERLRRAVRKAVVAGILLEIVRLGDQDALVVRCARCGRAAGNVFDS